MATLNGNVIGKFIKWCLFQQNTNGKFYSSEENYAVEIIKKSFFFGLPLNAAIATDGRRYG